MMKCAWKMGQRTTVRSGSRAGQTGPTTPGRVFARATPSPAAVAPFDPCRCGSAEGLLTRRSPARHLHGPRSADHGGEVRSTNTEFITQVAAIRLRPTELGCYGFDTFASDGHPAAVRDLRSVDRNERSGANRCASSPSRGLPAHSYTESVHFPPSAGRRVNPISTPCAYICG